VFRGPLTVGALAGAEQVTPATISRLVSELEALGLAKRSTDDTDGRVRHVAATTRGVALLKEGRRRRVARLAQGLEGLPEDDRRTLQRATDLLEEVVARRPPV
jgi:DNA-binding MarR family transcriptional regulator